MISRGALSFISQVGLSEQVSLFIIFKLACNLNVKANYKTKMQLNPEKEMDSYRLVKYL